MTTEPVLIDPAVLMRYLGDGAVGRLDEYFHSGMYTGGQFERFAGGGDRPATVGAFTSDDIVAVSLLGVRIPGRAALQVLDVQTKELNALLGKIPARVDLWLAEEEIVGPDSAADQLWTRLVDLPGISWVTAGKLLARKRPRLVPVYDRVVRAALGRTHEDGWWRPLRAVLSENDELINKLTHLRERSALGDDVSLLRVLDVSIWMREYGQPEPVPDAET